jgi:uroporphyrinogen-III synthase
LPETQAAEPRRVLITRPEPGATETARRITALGLVPIVTPLQEIVPLPARLPPPGRVGALVLTSRNAIGPIPPGFRTLPCWAVGNATADRSRDAGFTDVRSADGDAPTLAALVAENTRPEAGPILLVTGRGHGAPLCALLRQAGFRVVRRVVYDTRPAKRLPAVASQALMAGQPASVLFFSAEAARVFCRLLERASLREATRTCDAVAISPAVGMALRTDAWATIRVAARPNQDAMLALL